MSVPFAYMRLNRWNPLSRMFFTFLCLFAMPLYAKVQGTDSLSKVRLEYYHDSGRYQKDIQSVVGLAERYLCKRIRMNDESKQRQRLAIVLDIDETTLSNYPDIKKIRFSVATPLLRQRLPLREDPAIQPTLALVKLAQKNQVSVFFVTGRMEKMRATTISNLKEAGFSGWAGLYLKSNTYFSRSVIPYKTAMRKKIAEQGYVIVLTMGDQMSDLVGGYADRKFKLPNPFYFIP
jgi:predicted secreted acid phosphatase